MSVGTPYVSSRDKVILSDLLFYVYNAFHSTPKQVIIDACVNFYDEDSIWYEKSRLFDAVGKKATLRRTNAKNKNVEDILAEIEARDSGNLFLPIFATSSLQNIPSSHDGEVTNNQIFHSLRVLKKDIMESIKSTS